MSSFILDGPSDCSDRVMVVWVFLSKASGFSAFAAIAIQSMVAESCHRAIARHVVGVAGLWSVSALLARR